MEARFLRLLAEFDQRGGWAGDGIRSCVHWLAIGAQLTGNVEGLIEMNTRARLRIEPTILTPDCDGDRLDPEPILDALLPRRVKTAA